MAIKKMQDRIMHALPAPGRVVSIAESLVALKAQKDKDEYLIGNLVIRNLLNGVIEMVCQLQAGSGPLLSGIQDDWTKRLHVALPLFFTAKASDGSLKRGIDAFELRLKECKQKEQENKLMFDDLTELHTFEFLATASLKSDLAKMTEKLLQGTRTTIRKRGQQDTMEMPKEKKSKKGKKEKDNTTAAEVDALFNM